MTLRVWAALLSMIVGLWAGEAWGVCNQQCETQDFTSDPFQGPTPKWTVVNPTANCPVVWDSVAGTIKRTVGATDCDHTDTYIRYNGNISQDGCAIFKIVISNNGAGNHVLGFEPGMVFRDQTIPSTNLPNQAMVRCEQGLGCAELRYSTDSQNYDFINQECGTLTALAEGSYLGVCASSVGAASVVNVFNFAAEPASGPDSGAGGGGWGAPQCAFLGSLSGAAYGLDNSGNYWGIWMRTNDVSNGAVYEVDNFKAYSCP